MAAPACKGSWTAQSAERLGEDVVRALHIARSGRPGPVHLSLPTDVMETRPDQGEQCIAAVQDFALEPVALAADAAAIIVERLARAQRPLILTGPIMGNGSGRLLRSELQRASGVPVLYLESPRGIADPSLGALAEVLARADLVLMLGKKLDFTVKFGHVPAFDAGCEFIQVDPDTEALRRAALAIDRPARILMALVVDTVPAARAGRVCAAARPACGRLGRAGGGRRRLAARRLERHYLAGRRRARARHRSRLAGRGRSHAQRGIHLRRR